MARTKLIARGNYNCRRANYQRCRVGSGIKNIEGRIRNRHKHWNLKKWTRRMTVRRKTIFPGNRPAEYWYYVK